MSDKQVKVQKPTKPKPETVKPQKTKPENMKPIKAKSAHNRVVCARCSKEVTNHEYVRSVCSACDLDLQRMHHGVEFILFDKVTYMPEKDGEEQSVSWYKLNGYSQYLGKPFTPRYRHSRHLDKANAL